MSNSDVWANYIHEYVVEQDLLDFYHRFLLRFEDKWSQFTSNYNFQYLCQLNNGNRLRPMLVYWGFLLNKSDDFPVNIENEELDYIIDFCIMIEAIHKMSLLVDDWIDGDIARHGAPTFHVVYGADTAVLLAMNLLLKGYLDLSNRLIAREETHQKSMSIALQIAYDMTLGALDEVSSAEKIIEVSKVKQIVDLETSSIIRNGLILGFTAGKGTDPLVIDLLDDIGYCCGYSFQALNDLEPFGNVNDLIKHKGALSTDILKNRKNIVVAYIYAWATKRETELLESIVDANEAFDNVVSLINKYKIKTHLIEEVSNLQMRIYNRIDKIEALTSYSKWCKHFKGFIDVTISASKDRALGK